MKPSTRIDYDILCAGFEDHDSKFQVIPLHTRTHTHIHTSLGAGVVVKTLDDRSALVLMQSPLQYAGNSLGEWTFGDYQCWAHLAARRGFDKITHVCITMDIVNFVLKCKTYILCISQCYGTLVTWFSSQELDVWDSIELQVEAISTATGRDTFVLVIQTSGLTLSVCVN